MLRVRLRPPSRRDAAAVAPWLPEAVAAIQGRGNSVDSSLSLEAVSSLWHATYPSGTVLLGELIGGAVAGILRVRTTPPGWLVIDALAVRADLRNLGYGQEMVFSLEETRGTPGVTAAAGVPRGNGLAIYFWLRTGYRSLYPRSDGTAAELSPNLLWMVRELE